MSFMMSVCALILSFVRLSQSGSNSAVALIFLSCHGIIIQKQVLDSLKRNIHRESLWENLDPMNTLAVCSEYCTY